jgi:outer membrane protein assembly factor BamE (lipoprotein component of BamABCDE complex)
MAIVRLSLIIALVAALAACGARREVRGNYLTDTQLAKIKVGSTNRDTVLHVLGPPSTEGTFDRHVWYYIGRQTEEWAFLNPEVLDQRVLAVYFNDKGIVEHLQRYSYADARQVDIVARETPTSGHKIGFFEQILGNLGVLGGGGSSSASPEP